MQGFPDLAVPSFETGPDPEPDVPPPPPDGLDDVDLELACEPDCQFYQCGDDGCGGTCGECDPGFACTVYQQCEATGASCDAPIQAGTLPWQSIVQIAETDSGGCGDGIAQPDVVIRLDPPASGLYEVEVLGAPYARVFAASTCGSDASCLADGLGLVVLDLVSTDPVYLVVESPQLAPGAEISVAITSCADPCTVGACGPGKCGVPCSCQLGELCSNGVCKAASDGDWCTSPLVLDLQSPMTVSLPGYADSFDCQEGSADAVFFINPNDDLPIAFELDGAPDASFFIETDCGAAECSAGHPVGKQVGYIAIADQSTYVVVELGSGASASLIAKACAPGVCGSACPCPIGGTCKNGACDYPETGDNCDDAIALGLEPIAHNTVGVGDTQSCAQQLGGSDVVFDFVAPHAGRFGFDVVSPYGVSLYTLETCGAPQTCLQPEGPALQLAIDMLESQSIILVVDAPDPLSDGGFVITATDCDGQCAAAGCAAVVCGAQCGCADGKVCDGTTCVDAAPLDSCATAVSIDEVPFQVEGSLVGLNDSLGCGPAGGLGTPDALYAFTAPKTGVYTAALSPGSSASLLLPIDCISGGQQCGAPPASKQTFLAHGGEVRHLAVDGPGPEATYQLSLVQVLGLSGALGSGCTTDADCPLADACVFGVCTVDCAVDEPTACSGAAEGPRGSAFGCPADVCVSGDAGCTSVCLPGVETGALAACSGPPCPASGSVCAGPVSGSGLAATGACVASGTLGAHGASCAANSDCASDVCVAGTCRALCASTSDCPASAVCALTETPFGIHGLCTSLPSSPEPTCTTDGDCAGGQCTGHLGPDGGAAYYCQPKNPDLAAPGSPCELDLECQSGICAFAGFYGLVKPYCASLCPSGGGCPAPLTCHSVSQWFAGTPGDATDDYVLPLCVLQEDGAPCLLDGVDTCGPTLSCKPFLDQELFGACQ